MPPEAPAKLEDGHKPWAPVFEDKVPEESSNPPAKEEWETAPIAKDVRITDPTCHAQRIREWYRLRCESDLAVEMISGRQADVTFGCKKERRDDPGCDVVWVIFPARRGDRRSFELFRWGKWGPEPDVIATEQFLPGDARPMVSVQGIRFGF
jgi:hypothetical protein